MMQKSGDADSYFIPNSVTVGLFGIGNTCARRGRDLFPHSASNYGFVTCRFKYDQWISPGIFERLTKYKPSNQRDRAAQLRKSVDGSVLEVVNEPVSGFRLIAWRANPYNFCAKEYDVSGDVIIEDSRGFMVALGSDQFFESLKMCGGELELGGKLAGEFVYGWENTAKCLVLIPASHPKYKTWKAASDACATKDAGGRHILKKDLVVGRVYRAAKVLDGDWMYVGVRDTYSQSCHVDAYDNGGKYDVDKFIQREAGSLREKWKTVWPTTRGKYVFYSMSPRAQQYVVRSDVYGIFSEEVQPMPDGTYENDKCVQYTMYSDPAKPVTLDNVADDMASSPAFAKIVFSEKPDFVQMPYGSFSLNFENSCREPRIFPFMTRYSAYTVMSNGNYVKVSPSMGMANTSNRCYKMFDIAGSMKLNSTARGGRAWCVDRAPFTKTTSMISLLSLYGALSPKYPVYTFENGKAVRPEHAIVFVPADFRRAAEKLY